MLLSWFYLYWHIESIQYFYLRDLTERVHKTELFMGKQDPLNASLS